MDDASPPTARRTLTVQLVLFLLVFFMLLAGLHLLDPFVDSLRLRAWLEQRLSFLNAGARGVLVRHGWQALVAAIVAVKASSWLKPLASVIAERRTPGFPPFLMRPGKPRELLESQTQQLTLVGRTRELEALLGFLTGGDRLSWWWVNGGAGSGKSRLALEWIDALRRPLLSFSTTRYDAGLFEPHVAENEWVKLRWKPRRPTVIVVDNAAERMSAILAFMESLGVHSSTYDHPVRVLLVERSVPEELMKLHTSSRLYDHCYKLDALTVSPLGAADIRELGRELGTRLGRLPDLSDDAVHLILDVSKGLPLFVIYALQDLPTHGHIRVEARDQLLRKELLRTRGKMQEHGVDKANLPLLALATFVRGLSWEAAATYLQTLPSPKKAALDRLFQEDTARAIPPIGPDILGEHFVLEEFGGLTEPERQRFLNTAWQISPSNVSATLVRLAMDFPNHASLVELDTQPANQDDALWWGRVRVRLLGTGRSSANQTAHYLQQLQRLAEMYAASAEFQNVLAQGLARTNHSYRAGDSWDESLSSLRHLVEFARSHRNNIQVQLILAQAAADVLAFVGRGQHEEELQLALQVQADLSQIDSVRHNADFQVTMAVTAARSMRAGNWQSYQGGFTCLNEIAGEFPAHGDIQQVVARTAMDALAQWYSDVLDTDPWFGTRGRIDPQQLGGVRRSALETLWRVVNHDTPDAADLPREIAAAVAKTLATFIYDWERMDRSLEILEAVARRYPEDVNIQIAFVKAAVDVLRSCVHFSKHGERAAEMQDIVRRMTGVVSAPLRKRQDISELFAAAESCLGKTVDSSI
jgi:hypothetical protein